MTMGKIYEFPCRGGIDACVDAIAQHLSEESHPTECVEYVSTALRKVLFSHGVSDLVVTVPAESAGAVGALVDLNNSLIADLVFAVTRIWYLEFRGGMP